MNRERNKEKIKQLQSEFRKQVVEVILKEFRFRRYHDIKYCIRKFAVDIGMNHVHLSQVLLDQRGLSRKKAEQISEKFNLDYEGRIRFFRLVSACGRSKLKRNMALLGLKNAKSKKEKFYMN